MYVKETIQKHSTDNTKHSKYKYTHYQNTHTLQKPHAHPLSLSLSPTYYKTHTYTHIHTLQNTHIHTPTRYKTS